MSAFTFLHNYHTHTTFCRHARNTVEEMIKAAISNGYKTIGFSEHAPLKIHRNFRLNLHSWTTYIDEVNTFKKKYAKKIKVLCGLETEYHKSSLSYYRTLKNTPGIDYMIFGNHNAGNPHLAKEWNAQRVDLKQYGIQLVDGIKSGLFSAVAHPDYIFRYYPEWDESCDNLSKLIINNAQKYKIPLGFNLNGMLKKKNEMHYPVDKFWSLVSKSKCQVIIECDAHRKETLSRKVVAQGIKLISKWNLAHLLINEMELV